MEKGPGSTPEAPSWLNSTSRPAGSVQQSLKPDPDTSVVPGILPAVQGWGDIPLPKPEEASADNLPEEQELPAADVPEPSVPGLS